MEPFHYIPIQILDYIHIYHLYIVKHLSYMDYFHHILFIGTGVIPSLIFYNINLIRLAWFPTCGLPGCIEYLTLALVKHDRLCHIKQKRLNCLRSRTDNEKQQCMSKKNTKSQR